MPNFVKLAISFDCTSYTPQWWICSTYDNEWSSTATDASYSTRWQSKAFGLPYNDSGANPDKECVTQ